MSKIIKNNTASPVPVNDTGITIPASGQYLVDPGEYPLFSRSDDIVVVIGDLTVTISNGTDDLGISDGIRLIQDNFPASVAINGATDIKITNLSLPTSGTEVSHTFTDTLKSITLRSRNKSQIQYCFVSGESNTKYVTLRPNAVLNMDGLSFLGKTIHMQSSTDGEVVEIQETYL